MISEVDNTFENDSHHSTVQPSNNKATPEIIFPSTELSKTPDAAPKCSENTEEVEDVLNTASPVSTNFQINSVHDESLNETFDGDNDEMHNTSNVEGNVEETDSIPNVSVVENLTNDDSAKKIKIDHKTEKISQFPLGRIKDIMKSDPDVNIVGAECVFLLAKATVNNVFLHHIYTLFVPSVIRYHYWISLCLLLNFCFRKCFYKNLPKKFTLLLSETRKKLYKKGILML